MKVESLSILSFLLLFPLLAYLQNPSIGNGLLKESKILFENENYVQALKMADSAMVLFLNNSFGLAKALNQKAACLTKLGEYGNALVFYTKSDSLISETDSGQMEVNALNIGGSGVCYYELSDYPAAKNAFEKELEINLSLYGKNSGTTARNYNNLGNCFSDRGLVDTALQYYFTALDIYRKIGEGTALNAAMTYKNIGRTLKYGGRYWESLKYLDTCLIVRKKNYGNKKHENMADSYINLGKVFLAVNEIDKALYLHKMALQSVNPNSIPEKFQIVTALGDIGNCYYELGDYNRAMQFYEYALNTRLSFLPHHHPNILTNYASIGRCHRANGQLDSALVYYLKAIDMVSITFGEISTGEAYFNLLIGNVYFEKSDIDKAMLYYEEGLQVLTKLNVTDQPLNIALENGRAYCKLKTGRLADADILFKKSMLINQYIDEKFDKIIYLNGFISSTIGLIKLNYEKYTTTGDAQFLEQARTYGEISIKGMQDKINSTVSYDTKTLFKDKFREVFEMGLKVQANTEGNKIDQNIFFSLLEKSKQSLLQNEVSAVLKLYESELPDSLLEKELALNKSIDKWEKKKDEMTKSGIGELDSARMQASLALFDLKEKRQKLLDYIADNFPTYSRLKFELNTIGLDRIRKEILGKNKALLEYFVGKDNLYAMLVTSDTVDIKEVPIKNLNGLVSQLQNGITGFHELSLEDRTDEKYKATLSDYIIASQKLYDLLIRPFRRLLREEVIIVPDGKLHLIPFGALLSGSPPAQKNFNTYPFLEKKHVISYCFSASLLYNIKNRKYRDAPMKSIAAFAPFYKSGYQPFFSNQGRDTGILPKGLDTLLNRGIIVRSGFDDLPYSGEEALSVSSLMEGDVFLDERATINQFYEIIGRYRIVHLSTHGGANNNNGSYSYLIFADKNAGEGGGVLFAKDLYSQNIKADMVVLSACETGTGELKKSEGVVSLAKAFVYAGAKSVVTTLWSVEDESTKDIITGFYRSIKNGEKKNIALYEAKNIFLKNNTPSFKHPFFWAGLVPFGDMSAME